MAVTHRISVGDATLHASVEGPANAPWLTCLHALATDMRLWDDQVAALSSSHRLLRLDLRGHGGSTLGLAGYSIEDLALDVIAVWDSLGVAKSAVLGLSIGGMIGLALALNHPDRVTRLIAADCRSDAPPAFIEMFDKRDRALDAEGLDGIAALTIPTWLSPETRLTRPDMISRAEAMLRGTRPDGYRAATAALRRLALRPRLPELTVPTLFLVGSLDGAHPQAMRDMAAAVPGSRIEEIEGAAHLANLDEPQAFTAAVLSFLGEA